MEAGRGHRDQLRPAACLPLLHAARPSARRSGWLRLLFLTVGGRRIATSYASCYQDRLFFFKTGYDPEYAEVLAVQAAHVLRRSATPSPRAARSGFPRRHRALEARMDDDDTAARLAVRVRRHAASAARCTPLKFRLGAGDEAMAAALTGCTCRPSRVSRRRIFVRPRCRRERPAFRSTRRSRSLLSRAERDLSPVSGAAVADGRA